jgi:hypothetical protein
VGAWEDPGNPDLEPRVPNVFGMFECRLTGMAWPLKLPFHNAACALKSISYVRGEMITSSATAAILPMSEVSVP